MVRSRRTLASAVAALAVALALVPGQAHAAPSDVPTPTVSGPVPVTATSRPFLASDIDLAARGYVEREYVLSGGALKYAPISGTTTSSPVPDGPNADGSYPYATRIVVRRPIDPAKYNGTTLLEWQNVTAGFDIEWNWFNDPEALMRKGYAWVGVSAQRAGIDALKAWNPARYGSLDPGGPAGPPATDVSYDIFSQAAKAVRGQGAGRDPMGGLETQTLVASGESQSGSRLNGYYNGIQAFTRSMDAFFITVAPPPAGGLRTDLPEKVLRVLSEREFSARPAAPEQDTATLRRWEVAGGSHLPEAAYRNWAPTATRDLGPQSADCVRTPLSKVQWPYVADAGLDALVRWQRGGAAPATAPRSEYDGPAAGAPVSRDAYGNGRGGIRLPAIDVPVAQESSINSPASLTNPFSAFCGLLGSHVAFTPVTLTGLYADFGAYVDAIDAKADALRGSGFVDEGGIARLKADARRFTRLRPTAPTLTDPAAVLSRGTFALGWRGADPDRTDTVYELQRRSASGTAWSTVPGAEALRDLDRAFSAGDPAPEGTHAFRVRSTTNTEATPVEPSRTEVTPFSDELAGVVVDRTAPPAPTLETDRAPEAADGGWFRDRVTVTPTAAADPALADGSPGSGVDPATLPGPTTVDVSGERQVAATVADRAGNRSGAAARAVRVDADPPAVAALCPAGVFVGDEAQAEVVAGDGESGLAPGTPEAVRIDTATSGVRTTTVQVADRVGHAATASCRTTVRSLPVGPAGPAGAPGTQGAPGAKGPKGSRGPRGRAGRDARVRCTTRGTRRVRVTCRVTFARRAKARVLLLRGDRILDARAVVRGRTLTLRSGALPRGARYTVLVTVDGEAARRVRGRA
jgi:hypothetical protein